MESRRRCGDCRKRTVYTNGTARLSGDLLQPVRTSCNISKMDQDKVISKTLEFFGGVE